MKPHGATRALIGVGAVLVLSLLACLDYYQAVEEFNRSYQDPYLIEEQAQRFREVKAMLPAESVVGYVSDAPAESVRGAAMFFGAQYALAPRLLDPHKTHANESWVVANFSQPVELGQIEKENRIRLFKDLAARV